MKITLFYSSGGREELPETLDTQLWGKTMKNLQGFLDFPLQGGAQLSVG